MSADKLEDMIGNFNTAANTDDALLLLASLTASLGGIADTNATTGTNGTAATETREAKAQRVAQRQALVSAMEQVLNNSKSGITTAQADAFIGNVAAVSGGGSGKAAAELTIESRAKAASMLTTLAAAGSVKQKTAFTQAVSNIITIPGNAGDAEPGTNTPKSKPLTEQQRRQQAKVVTKVIEALEIFSLGMLGNIDPANYTEPIETATPNGRLKTQVGYLRTTVAPVTTTTTTAPPTATIDLGPVVGGLKTITCKTGETKSCSVAYRECYNDSPALCSSTNLTGRDDIAAHKARAANSPNAAAAAPNPLLVPLPNTEHIELGAYSFQVPHAWLVTPAGGPQHPPSYTSVVHERSPYFTERSLKSSISSLSLFRNGESDTVSNRKTCVHINRRQSFTTRQVETFTTSGGKSNVAYLQFDRRASDMSRTMHVRIEPFFAPGETDAADLDVFVSNPASEYEFLFQPVATRDQVTATADDSRAVAHASHVLQLLPRQLRNTACQVDGAIVTNHTTDVRTYTVKVMTNLTKSRVNFSLTVSHYECLFLNETSQRWSHEGCSVSPLSSPGILGCRCNHLTVFGGTQQTEDAVLIKPNMVRVRAISGDDIADNSVVFVAVVLLWFIFLAILYNSYQADKRAALATGPISLPTNNNEHHGRFQITVNTGIRANAGIGPETRVYIQMFGTFGLTHEIELTHPWRPVFQRGANDVFVITTPFDIGRIRRISIRQDGHGENPCWYLCGLEILNMNLGEASRRYFWINNWLSYRYGFPTHLRLWFD